MGASEFRVYIKSDGITPDQAFEQLVNQAQWEHGHSGYTGTIAEKASYTEMDRQPVTPRQAERIINEMLEGDKIGKWEPALMLYVLAEEGRPAQYVFFGLASS